MTEPSTTQPAGRLKVDFMPFNRENLYWRNLADNLSKVGVEVGECGMLKGMMARFHDGRPTPDVLHMHWMPSFELTSAGIRRLPSFIFHLRALRRRGLRMIWTAHNLYHAEVLWRAADRWVTRMAVPYLSRVIAHTRTAKDIVCREFRIHDQEKITVIPHGHYIESYPNVVGRDEARRQLGLPQDEVVFAFVGHIRPYKGVNDLIDAFHRLQAPARLVIAGKPIDEKTVRMLHCRIASNNRVILRPGFIPDDMLQFYLNAADVMVVPYQQVLTSGAVVLGMSFGRACVAASLGCIPDMIDEGGGFLYNPRNRDGLAGALEQAAADRGRLAEMGHRNLERARGWDWTSIAVATAGVYARAIGRPALSR